jgi:hypothetical protein
MRHTRLFHDFIGLRIGTVATYMCPAVRAGFRIIFIHANTTTFVEGVD